MHGVFSAPHGLGLPPKRPPSQIGHFQQLGGIGWCFGVVAPCSPCTKPFVHGAAPLCPPGHRCPPPGQLWAPCGPHWGWGLRGLANGPFVQPPTRHGRPGCPQDVWWGGRFFMGLGPQLGRGHFKTKPGLAQTPVQNRHSPTPSRGLGGTGPVGPPGWGPAMPQGAWGQPSARPPAARAHAPPNSHCPPTTGGPCKCLGAR